MSKARITYYFKKLLPFPIIWLIGASLYFLLEKGILGNAETYPSTGNLYDFKASLIGTLIGSVMMGFLMGFLEVTLFKNLLKRKSFLIRVSVKVLFYILFISAFLLITSLATTSQHMGLGFFHPDVLESLYAFIGNYVFLSIIIYAGIFSFMGFFVTEAIDGLGLNNVANFFTGRYSKPRIEQRIFMFLDMKSSTTIAESLGNIAYYKLLRDYYRNMTDAIISNRGEVYQYVGDEIVISWSLKSGLRNNNCLQCFLKIKKDLQKKRNLFQEKYGIFPEFKAGIHFGEVTAGTIGVIKKEILYTGDVLNTTARIQSKCNDLDVELLISEDLFNQIPQTSAFSFMEKGQFELRGKNEKVKLYTIPSL